jgi:hypothetical protein
MKIIFTALIIISLSCEAQTNKLTNKAINNLETAGEAEDAVRNIDNPDINPENGVQSSSYISSTLYKGTLNNNIKISLYIIEQENACGGDITFFTAMYKYDNQNKWILLEVIPNREKKNFCMVEDFFTGTLFLKKINTNFIGNWISPDTKKQFKVELEDQLLNKQLEFDKAVIETLDEILFDDLLYNKNDC